MTNMFEVEKGSLRKRSKRQAKNVFDLFEVIFESKSYKIERGGGWPAMVTYMNVSEKKMRVEPLSH